MSETTHPQMPEEPIIDPDRAICDPHHHLWDYPHHRYLLDELLADVSSGHNVVSTVFMECMAMYRANGPEAMKPVGETEFVNGIAAMSASGNYGKAKLCASIVGFADLTLGSAVGEVLDAHIAASRRFVGIRHASGWSDSDAIRNSHTRPTQDLLSQPLFQEGMRELKKRNLTFDAWLYHPQIDDLTVLARAFPDQIIIFDHFGGPLGIGPFKGQSDEVFTAWKQSVAELAKCRNVYAKLGGLAMPINGFDLHKRAVGVSSEELAQTNGHYYHFAIENFGPERCMFESNFPVDKVSCSYAVLWNAFKRLAQSYSEDEQVAMFHDTAATVYKVPKGVAPD